MNPTIFIAGDVVPMRRTAPLFQERQADVLFGAMREHICSSDLSIVNLEAPIAEKAMSRIRKSGPSLCCASSTLETLKEAGFNTITLANNHFRDYGEYGVHSTINHCKNLNMKFLGGGNSSCEARRPLQTTIRQKSITIINACETEFSIATERYGGSNPLDLIQIDEDIVRAKQRGDIVLLILHGGVEHYHLPTPRMQKWYRHFVDMGADAVVNHHQHCISGYEIYQEKPIFYGLGNFCFDSFREQPVSQWNYGYAVKLTVDKKISFELIPYTQCAEQPKLNLRKYSEFEDEIQRLNAIIQDEYLLEQKFNEYVLQHEKGILGGFLPLRTRYIRGAYRRGWLGRVFSTTHVYGIKNKLVCQSHYDVASQLFKLLTLDN